MREQLSFFILLFLTAIVVALALAIAFPFAAPLTWAIVITVLAWPMHEALCRGLGNRNLAAAVSVLIVAIAILAPVVWIGFRVSGEVTTAVKHLREAVRTGAWQAGMERHPALIQAYNWLNERVDLTNAGFELANSLKGRVGSWLGSGVRTIVETFICLFALFFLFRDRLAILRAVRSRLPLSESESELLLGRLKSMVRAAVVGRMVTAMVQGALGGMMFWILGLDAALLWGLVMACLSTIPAVGSIFIWAPAAVWLAISGHWVKAIILVAWGSAVVGTIDNILYPLLVGRDVRLHTLLLFISLLGGVLLFGPTGRVLGPVVMETALTLVEIVRSRRNAALLG